MLGLNPHPLLTLLQPPGSPLSRPEGSKKRKIDVAEHDEPPSASGSGAIPTPVTPPVLEPLDFHSAGSALQDYMEELSKFSQLQVQGPSKAFITNVATSGAWALLLPKLVYPLMKQLWIRRTGNNPAPESCPCVKQEAKVNIVSFTSEL